MAENSFLIADLSVGLELDKKPFLIPDDAFPVMENALLFRKRIQRKIPNQQLGRLRRDLTSASIGNTGASPWTFTIYSTLAAPNTITGEPQAQIIPGTVVITIAGPIVFTDQGNGTLTSATGGNSGTINYATGSVTLTHTAGAGVATTITFSYFPGLPVMGLPNREVVAINAEQLVAFDTKYCYTYNNSTNRFIESTSTMVARWAGTNGQFFWSLNAQNALFVDNAYLESGASSSNLQGYAITAITAAASAVVTVGAGHLYQVNDYVFFWGINGMVEMNGLTGQVTAIAANTITVNINSAAFTAYTNGGVAVAQNRIIDATKDNLRWYDGTTFANHTPPVNATTFLIGASFFFYYRGRLVCLDTQETTAPGAAITRNYQRARYSQNGTIYYAANPLPSSQSSDAQAYREDVGGRGGFVDAPTQERITSAALLKDTLIVFFERSTWKLRYTGNEILPFVWERVNSELGSESPFSTVLFDIGPMTVGLRGIIQSDGVGSARIDQLIPEEVFQFHNENSGPSRVHGIRDFDKQLVYWAFPNEDENLTFPNRILVYNYREQSWSNFGDSFTCFGYWQRFSDLTWATSTTTWETSLFSWGSQIDQALYQKIVGGNQQGFVLALQEPTGNAPLSGDGTNQCLRIESITSGTPVRITSTDHTLSNDQIIRPAGIIGAGSTLNNNIYRVQVISSSTFDLYSYDSASKTFSTPVTVAAGTYLGGGEIRRIDNFKIRTKQFNPYMGAGRGTSIEKIDFLVSETSEGKFTVNLYVDGNENFPVNPVSADNEESNVVETFTNVFETSGQSRLWHTLYDQITGNFFQFEMMLSNSQMNDIEVAQSDVVIHAMNIVATPASRRLS